MKQNTTMKELTPVERLKAEKLYFKQLSKQHEKALTADFQYIQKNASTLLLSGLSSLIFPGFKSVKAKEPTPQKTAESSSSPAMELSGYISLAKEMLPVAWHIIQPIILTWGIKQTQKWLSNKLFKKKK